MNENTKKGAIGEGESLVIGGFIQIDTEGTIQHTKKSNTNTKDEGIDYEREIDKTEFKKTYKDYISKLKKDGGKKKWVQKLSW